MKNLNALLFDTRSIQRYIFSGNRLSTNIGASYIVDKIFSKDLVDTLKKIFPDEDFSAADDSVWNFDGDNSVAWQEMKNVCVAYIGGGNALILFDAVDVDEIKNVVKIFTRRLLGKYPGLKVGVAIGELNVDTATWTLNKADLDELYRKLKNNQSNVFPAVNVPYSGLTLNCDVNGETANFYGVIKQESGRRFYSQEVAAKFNIAAEANQNLKTRFEEIFYQKNIDINVDNYDFPLKVDELGQKDGDNYFAVVHVDGNNMGLKFRSCETLSERRKLSREIKRKTEGAFAELLAKIIQMKDADKFGEHLRLDDYKLPIRPLIIGGDDITFICPAKTAILFTKTLMEIMSSEPKDELEHLTYKFSRRMDCCAGVAILHGEQAPTLKQIRQNEYSGVIGDMHFGPYRVNNFNAKNAQERRHNIENLIECAAQFSNRGRIAMNKVKELRGVLQHGKDEIAKFMSQLEHQQQKLPEIADWRGYLKNYLWSEENSPKTPYIDAIEFIDFYVAEVAEAWQSLK